MLGGRDHDRRLLGFARRMRREGTDAEGKLWAILRDRRLVGYKFRRQVPVAGYIVDFYCVKAGLVIELDGGQHSEATHRAYDAERTRRLKELGIEVMRFWDHEVLKDPEAVAEMIYRKLCGEGGES
ncbi:MAG: endonuclease domain-containing protein [Bacillota bacterium]